ncbi:MAG: PfkB family carbohydrate kinase [Ferruginibacter sp.]
MKKNRQSNSGRAEMIALLPGLLRKQAAVPGTKKITAGFDGFVDAIVKVIKNKPEKKRPSFFNTKKEFGNYIIDKAGTSFSLELEELTTKQGGNMPIMANALGRLGIGVNCIGALGYPQLHPAFKDMSANCSLHSFADPGISTAVEFNDGKIILGQMNTLNNAGWQNIKDRIGMRTLTDLYKKSDLLCIVNWAEIDTSSEIWQGLLEEILPTYKSPVQKQTAFFDLSDCSKRSPRSISGMLGQLSKFSRFTNVILGLNQNEARLIYQVLYKNTTEKGLAFLGEKIFDKLAIDTLVLHSSKEAIAINKEAWYTCKSFFVKKPTISTGAGDNFNAGFCAARLMELNMESTLIFAGAVAGIYTRTGRSPELTDVINFLENKPS